MFKIQPHRLSKLPLPLKLLHFFGYKIKDVKNSDNEQFNEYGLSLYVGRQGAGKTTAMTEYLERMRVKYPNALIVTNYGYKNEDIPFESLDQFLTIRNGLDGVIFAIDELQNEFDSANWRSLPSGFLSEITQQRKQRIKVVGTTQVFTRVTKALREQAMDVTVCRTFAGRFTFTRTFDAADYNDVVDSPTGKSNLRRLSTLSFVQSDDLRSLYDSYAKIEKIEREGFDEIAENIK